VPADAVRPQNPKARLGMSGSFLKWISEHPAEVEHVRVHGAQEVCSKGNASVSSGVSVADHSSESSADEG
jgi:hypothetical protein